MKRIRNIVIGGIQNKIFNLILFTVLLLTAVNFIVYHHHSRMLSELAAESGERQQQAISEVTSEVMDETVVRTLSRSNQADARIADGMFSAAARRVAFLADCAEGLFAHPEDHEPQAWAEPDPDTDGEWTAKVLLAEGADAKGVFDAIDALNARADGLLYAVGDGNHSLAAARQCWLDIKGGLTQAQRANHPARFALVELVNLACPALVFEPIHRALFGVDPQALIAEYREALAAENADEGEGDDLVAFDGAGNTWRFRSSEHPLRRLQAFLDGYLARHPRASVDYIHGEAALRELVCRPDTLGFMPRAFDKGELFSYIRRYGVLPRKTFSMGEATEKRYYVEARRIV